MDINQKQENKTNELEKKDFGNKIMIDYIIANIEIKDGNLNQRIINSYENIKGKKNIGIGMKYKVQKMKI